MIPVPGDCIPIVQTESLTVRYGRRVALDDVTLNLAPGVIGLLGPNGAGKSTLLKTLLGFCRPAKGSAHLLGERAGARSLRRMVGYMPEREVTSPKLSAVSFVAYCGCLAGMQYRDALQRTHEVLNYVGFGEERYRTMETYSTGMRQRAKLAQALVHDPKLLFLDEPTNGLDPVGRVAMLELICDVARQRDVAILLSSHLLPDVEHVCERIVLLDQGKVVQQGVIKDLIGGGGTQFRVRVKADADRFASTLAEHGLHVAQSEDGALLISVANAVERRDVFLLAKSSGVQIREFIPDQNRLEDVFVGALAGSP
jgi:ABC-2 type transport system ATP-binding protein